MPKLKQLQNKAKKPNSLQSFLDTYDVTSLRGALLSFEASTGWELLKAYIDAVQRRFEVDALDLIAKQNQIQAAAYASGYAKALEDIKNSFIEGLHQTILGKSQVIEDVRPEE